MLLAAGTSFLVSDVLVIVTTVLFLICLLCMLGVSGFITATGGGKGISAWRHIIALLFALQSVALASTVGVAHLGHGAGPTPPLGAPTAKSGI